MGFVVCSINLNLPVEFRAREGLEGVVDTLIALLAFYVMEV